MRSVEFTWDDPEMAELLEIHDRGVLLMPDKERGCEQTMAEVMLHDDGRISIATWCIYEWGEDGDPFAYTQYCSSIPNNDEAWVDGKDRDRCMGIVERRLVGCES